MARTLVVILFGILSIIAAGNEWEQGTTSRIALIRLKYVVSIATSVQSGLVYSGQCQTEEYRI